MVTKTIPLVSVIIPMFNAAKFISQGLESLLNQTMQDFEIVVVDDGSTDNGVEVVESFAGKFGGRLCVIKFPKNTGTPGLPRNAGIQFAHGKYIAFLDSDDLYTKTALEELATLAENYQAEVVHTLSRFSLWKDINQSVDDPKFTDMNYLMNPANWTRMKERKDLQITEPIFLSEEMTDRIKGFVQEDTFWSAQFSIYRRDFLIDNQIFFPPMLTSEDASFTFSCICLAKKFLIVPNTTYIRRARFGSVSNENPSDDELKNYFHKKISALKDGLKILETKMDKMDFFKENPEYRFKVLDFFRKKHLAFSRYLRLNYGKFSAQEIGEFVKREFQSEDADFAAFLFNKMYLQTLRINELKKRISELEN